MRRKYLAILIAALLVWPYLRPVSTVAQSPIRPHDPFADNVMEPVGPITEPGELSETPEGQLELSGLPYDWDHEYRTRILHSPFDFAPSPSADNHQTFMAYDVGRYSVPAAVYMYRTSRDTSFMEKARDQIRDMFGPNYFQDGTNGANDGFLGWKFKRGEAINFVPGGIPRNQWQTAKIKVEDLNATQSRVSVTVNGQTFQETTTSSYNSGTVALLSGWAKTSFRNIVIRDPNGTILYDLNREGGTFNADWARVANPSSPNDTAYWTIQRTRDDVAEGEDGPEGVEEPESGPEMPPPTSAYIISSDATSNSPGPYYYPFAANALYNFGKPASGAADGKYSALVFNRAGFTSLRAYEVEFDIRLEKRNWGGAEQGVAVRQHSHSGDLLTGYRVLPPDPTPGQFPPAGTRNIYFTPNGRHIGGLFFPNGVRIAHDDDYGFFLGGPTWLAGGGFDKFVPNPKYQELAFYDGGATQGALEFIYAVYENHLEEFYPDADEFLVKLQNNIIAKWYQKSGLSTSDFVYGGPTNLDNGGTYKWATDPRFEIQFLGFYKLARDFPERWQAVTLAHPSPALPAPQTLSNFYAEHFRTAARSFVDSAWVAPGTNYYQWWGAGFNRSYWGEFSLWGSDLQHNSYTMYFLSEAMRYGFVSPEEFATLTRTFTEKIWNGQSDPNLINMGNGQPNPNYWGYAVDIHGIGNARINIHQNTTHLADYFPLLAESDFRVYEIFNTWLQHFAWNEYTQWWSNTQYFYGIHPAMMLYTVKFGRPRNLGVESVAQGNRLYWNHPSDWPGGTTLQYYNIYRRELNDSWPAEPLATVSTATTDYVDDQTVPGQVYLYQVRTQDNTQSFRNESDPSNVIAVKDGALTGGLALHAAPGDGSVLLYWDLPREVDPVDYEIQMRSGSKWESVGVTTAHEFTIGHLDNGREYWFRVRQVSVSDPAPGMDEAISGTPGAVYFIRHPLNRNACPGNNVAFRAAARGAGPMNFQWQRSTDGGVTWADLAGQTGSTYSASNVQSNQHNWRYRARIRTATGWVASDAATLTISNNCPNY